ncbi:unnamed protein product [Calypogeia fissa]
MAVHSSVRLSSNSYLRHGNHPQLSQFSFAYANSGQNLWQPKELPSLRRTDTKLRAERVTRRPQREGFERWQNADREDNGEAEGTSSWDANAENVRRRRSKRTYYSRPEEEDQEPSPSMRDRSNGYDNGRLDYEGNDRSGNSPWDIGRNNRYDNREWDYVEEPTRAETKGEGWQRWFGDNSGGPYGEDDEYEEEDNWLSWLNVDLKEALMLLRWGLPAAFLLCTAVLPVMIGNPLILLFGFTIFPTAVKYLNPLVKDFFRSAANPFGSSSSTRSKRQRQSSSPYSRRSQDTAQYTDFGSQSRQPTRSYDSDVPGQNVVPSKPSNLGGWDDLVEDRSRNSQRPLQTRAKSGRKLARREQPLVIRIILAFFPFLRGWAGLL